MNPMQATAALPSTRSTGTPETAIAPATPVVTGSGNLAPEVADTAADFAATVAQTVGSAESMLAVLQAAGSKAPAGGDPSLQSEESEPEADVLPVLPSFAAVWQPEVVSAAAVQRAVPAAGADRSSALAAVSAQPGAWGRNAVAGDAMRLDAAEGAAVSLPASGARPAEMPAPATLALADMPVRAAMADAPVALPAQALGQLGTAEPASASPAPSSAATLVAVPTKASQPLLQALSQRIQLQQAQGMDVVTVRLDPPQLGTLEVRIQHDQAGVQVLLQASHAEVGRQLAGVAEGLRQELQARTQGEASVVVAQGRQLGGGAGQGGQPRDGHGPWAHAEDDEIGQALQAWQLAADTAG